MAPSPVSLHVEGPVAFVTLDDGRGNALGTPMLEALDAALTEAEAARALVLRGREGIFSGGLDLLELAPLDRAGVARFLDLLDRICLHLLTFPRPVVTLAKGSAIAGGAIILCAGDERLAGPTGKMGLIEVQLGIFLPLPALEVARAAMGEAQAARAAATARLFEGEERMRAGFVTEIVDPAGLDARAQALAVEAARGVPAAVALQRRQLRREALERIERHSKADREAKLELWFQPETRQAIQAVAARLARKPG